MPRNGKKHSGPVRDLAAENFAAGEMLLYAQPIFAPLIGHAWIRREAAGNLCPKDGWAVVTTDGTIYVHPTRRGSPGEWAYVLAHCLLHLGFDHFAGDTRSREWNAACDLFVARFLADLKLGTPPDDMPLNTAFSARNEQRLYEELRERGLGDHFQALGTAGPHANDMIAQPPRTDWQGVVFSWPACFGLGLSEGITEAVNVAGGQVPGASSWRTPAVRARDWFMNTYPLLGALAAGFTIIENAQLCGRMDINIAAVNAETREVYMNPAAGLSEEECRFVMAHELLHVGLRHHARAQGRDPFLWNVACDYVINAWLIEMRVGSIPPMGLLHDPALKGESAESIYDLIVTDMRRFRKLATLRGTGLGDILAPGTPDWWTLGAGLELDEFYRRAMSQGLAYHDTTGRGTLPAGLIEEIRALDQPPIPWDVELAQWFDDHFAPLEYRRSYARASRRQSATPDIPRPQWVPVETAEYGRTFGVVLDTSGSMPRALLGKALGAIASYSIAHDVPAARVVFCDAAAYDAGYLAPDMIAERVQVRGRGGTVLQPGLDLLEAAEDFPKDGPILIITDGACDRFVARRDHAILLPEGHHLPFPPKGPVFRIR